MNRPSKSNRLVFLVLMLALWILTPPGVASESDCFSPSAVCADQDGKVLYVAGHSRVVAIDLDTKTVGEEWAFGLGTVTGLALAPEGDRLYVVVDGPRSYLAVLTFDSGNWIRMALTGHGPCGPVLSPDGKRLYLCSRFDHSVSVIDLAAKACVAEVPVCREPVAQALTADGSLLLVANLLPPSDPEAEIAAAEVTVIDTTEQKPIVSIPLANGSSSVRGICLAPDGKHAYVTHIVARYFLPTSQLERGWMNTNALSVIDVTNRSLLGTVLLDDVDLGAANPWGVACSPDGKQVCVSHAGSHELSLIDRLGLHEKLASRETAEIETDLAFLIDLRKRIPLPGIGPRGLVIRNSTVYVAEYFSDTISKVPLDLKSNEKPHSIGLVTRTPMSRERRGELLFHDARCCFQQWQSCASCHPDGRTDALDWDLLNDGMGNPRSTKSLLLAHATPPAMITGIRDSAEVAVRAGIRHIQFAQRPEEDAEAIDAYLKALKPVPSPFLKDGKLSEAAQRGNKIFARSACTACHPAPLYTNLRAYDVGTGEGRDEKRAFDVPTLVEVWRTAPYLYDSRAGTMKEVLTRFNPDDRHGVTSTLTEQEINDLVEFVLSL